MTEPEDRCRLVLIVPEGEDAAAQAKDVEDALRGGDVSSVILPQYGLDDQAFQKGVEKLVPIIQAAGAAALIAGDSRVAGRAKADGLHMSGGPAEIGEAIEKFTPKLIVGAGGVADRHTALEIGELRPDYIFFGKLDGDIKPEAHPKNLALGEWWASMVEIPCVVMGGSDIASALAVAETGAEFVALRSAVFAHPAGAAVAVAEINAMLDEKAPRFEV
ncbi:thiamine phosphate synthase [Rhizobium sp. LC145]|uniref:thiamine phosphate synthase n=1 Tax=Rhizobium sp. LC145 TaxID=1120688 RepID=UPI00062A23CB|nr:thiamine phosphate synthase [Rhizobium sp. LC145]KKX30882.1 thiamine-phosphate pyrophosphorylase [Rhizobium sp. LC145]TKT46440.1 thiamine phosphate synthase [Rhizobiaceae bacterium LC148]